MHSQAILNGSNLIYELPTSEVLFKNITVAIHSCESIGLVGRNGIGKSTLLKLLAKQMTPKMGTVTTTGSVYYVPQFSTLNSTTSNNSVLDLLNSVSDEWWTVTALLEEKFATELAFSALISSLSGGELMKLWLAIALSKRPDILLLDEPTNHLDLLGIEQLQNALQDFCGAFVVVSHKPFFLDRVVDRIWELTPQELKVYGGNYSFWRSRKESEHQAALRTHEVARKELKQAKISAAKEQKRAVNSRQQGDKNSGGIPKIVAGSWKRKAEVSAGIAKKKHEAAVEKASNRVAETKIKTTKTNRVQLSECNHKHKNLIDIQGASLRLDNRLLIEDIQLHISNGDRIAIVGANGSGKSSLANSIIGIKESPAILEGGEITVSSKMKVVYLDQTYELVNRNLTVLENMQLSNSNFNYQLHRQQLGHFLFFNDDVYKPALALSGGELARLAIAMISITEIDLLILDEPTNNLDIETINQIVDGLNHFQGALWVISHDIDFKSRIGIMQAYQIKKCQLKPLINLPESIEKYYQELIS